MTDERGADLGDGHLAPGIGATESTAGRRRISPRLIIAVVAAVIGLIVVLQNTNRVDITFLFFDGTMHVWTFALLMILIGVGLGQVGGVLIRRRRRRAADTSA
jgi:H+/Cl- antiporter ClcA